MSHWRRRVALFVAGIAGFWGMRTPPDPEVVPQMVPAPERGSGPAPPVPREGGEPPQAQVVIPRRRRRGTAGGRP